MPVNDTSSISFLVNADLANGNRQVLPLAWTFFHFTKRKKKKKRTPTAIPRQHWWNGWMCWEILLLSTCSTCLQYWWQGQEVHRLSECCPKLTWRSKSLLGRDCMDVQASVQIMPCTYPAQETLPEPFAPFSSIAHTSSFSKFWYPGSFQFLSLHIHTHVHSFKWIWPFIFLLMPSL